MPAGAPQQKSGFAQGLGIGTGCLLAGVIGFVLLIGGCGVLIAIGSSTGTDSSSSGSGSSSSGSTSQEELDSDLVDLSASPPDALGFVYVTVTVKNTSSKRSDYSINVNLESADGSTKYGDTFVWIRGVAPGQTASEKSLPISADTIAGTQIVVTDFDRTEAL